MPMQFLSVNDERHFTLVWSEIRLSLYMYMLVLVIAILCVNFSNLV